MSSTRLSRCILAAAACTLCVLLSCVSSADAQERGRGGRARAKKPPSAEPARAQTKKKQPEQKPQQRGAERERAAPKPTAAEQAAARDAAAAEAAADAQAQSAEEDAAVLKEGDTEVKVMEFSGLDIEGQLKTPQMLYFLNRLRAEFGRPRLPHRSFMPELQRTTKEKSF